MKKLVIVILVLIILVVVGFFIYSSNTKNEVTIKVTEKYWSGVKDFKDDKPVETEYTLKKGAVIKAKRFDTGYQFTIKKITKNSVTIESNNPISGKEGSIDLLTKETKFVINKGKKLELTEPTTDAGAIYIFEIIE